MASSISTMIPSISMQPMSTLTKATMLSMATMATQTQTALRQTAVPMAPGIFPHPLEPIKQQCGREGSKQKYDVGIHVLGLCELCVLSFHGFDD
jgi:hypothetical protein